MFPSGLAGPQKQRSPPRWLQTSTQTVSEHQAQPTQARPKAVVLNVGGWGLMLMCFSLVQVS